MSAVLLDCRGVPEEGRLLTPGFARAVIPKRKLSLAQFEALYAPIMGAANIFPLEGLNYYLSRIPQATITTVPTTLFLGLFTSQTATTVPSQDATLTGGAAGIPTGTSPVVEVTGGAYANVSMANTVWGASVTQGTVGSRTTATQQSFPQSTAAWGTVNGFFLCTSAARTLNGSTAIYYANFADNLGVAINGAGFTLSITPYLELDHT